MISLKDFFSFKKNRAFWLNLIAMPLVVIAVIFGVLHWLDIYTKDIESTIVPNVKGLPLKQAESELYEKGLKAIVTEDAINRDSLRAKDLILKQFKERELDTTVVDSIYVDSVLMEGLIYNQYPAGSTSVKVGKNIYLTIFSRKVPKVAIPDIIDNSSYRQAEARLRALGFKLTAPEIISGEKDWVYAVKCLEKELTNGEKIPRGSVLTLIIGDDEIKTDSLGTDSLIISTPKGTNPVIDDSWF